MIKPLRALLLAVAIIVMFGTEIAIANGFSFSGLIKQAEVIKVSAVTSFSSTAVTVKTMVRGFAANDPYMIKTMTVPKATFMGRFKAGFTSGGVGGLVKSNLWYAGFLATVGAAGWAIDELRDQIVHNVPPPIANYFPPSQMVSSCLLKDSGGYQVLGRSNTAYSNCSVGAGVTVNIRVTGGYTNTAGTTYVAPATYQDSRNLAITYTGTMTVVTAVPPIANPMLSEAVADDDIWNSLGAAMLDDPVSAADAFMDPDPFPHPYPQIFPDSVPYVPGVTESDQELLDLYAQGLLQSTNPAAAHYVTPEKLAEIAALAGELGTLQTPEGQVAAANDQLNHPLTQKELEESLKKQHESNEKSTGEALGELPNLTTMLDPYKNFEDGVKDTPNQSAPTMPGNSYGISGNGQCYVIDKPIAIMGVTITMSTREFCDAYYYPFFLPLLTWFFYVATGIYVWFSLRDTFSRRV